MIFLTCFVTFLVGIIVTIVLFTIMTHLDQKYDIMSSIIGQAFFYFGIIIPVTIAMVVTFCVFFNIKEAYEVVDIKNNGFYSQEILVTNNDNTYLLKEVSGQYEVGDKIELSVIYVEKNGNKID